MMMMMNRLLIICASLLLLMVSLPLRAQEITFEESPLPRVGVWDQWEESPFRSGQLTGNCKVVANPFADGGNPSAYVLGCQRSLYGSNLYGARVDLPDDQQFELTPQEKYLHVLIHKPVAGRCMLLVLGKHQEPGWEHQRTDVVQSARLSLNQAVPGQWSDVVFPLKGVGQVRATSVVIVFDCESPHRLTAPFVAYMDNIRLGDAVPQQVNPGDGALSRGDGRGNADTASAPGMVLVSNFQRNGEVLLSNGQPFNAGFRHPRRTPLRVKGVGEEGFICTGIIVHHGSGGMLSRLFTQEDFLDDGSLIIPAELLEGDILIEGVMTERK